MRPLEPHLALRRKLMAAARAAPRRVAHNGRPLPTAFFFTDPARTPDPAAIADRLPAGWGVVYRHYGAANRLEAGRRLAQACRRRKLILLVAADPGLARRIGAGGVHWPGRLLMQARSRRSDASSRWIVTASAHSRTDLVHAARCGADLAFLSTVFASASPSAARPMGALLFRRLAASARLPVYALGGVSAANAARTSAGFAAIESIVEGWEKAKA